MARYRSRITLKLDMNTRAIPDASRVPEAVEDAMRENALHAGTYAKELAEAEIVGPREGDIARGVSETDMALAYDAFVDDRGVLHLYNPTQRARWFEYGTEAHPITASPGATQGSRFDKIYDPTKEFPGYRSILYPGFTWQETPGTGQFIRGSNMLKFPNPNASGGFTYVYQVMHPGAPAHHVMRRTLSDNADDYGENIMRHVMRALTKVGQ